MLYDLNREELKPPNEVLAQCSRVIADGDLHKPKDMRDWARTNCDSLVWWDWYDMSDMSSWTGPDFCCNFYFYKEADATAFRLKWL